VTWRHSTSCFIFSPPLSARISKPTLAARLRVNYQPRSLHLSTREYLHAHIYPGRVTSPCRRTNCLHTITNPESLNLSAREYLYVHIILPGTCHVATSPNEPSTHNYQPRSLHLSAREYVHIHIYLGRATSSNEPSTHNLNDSFEASRLRCKSTFTAQVVFLRQASYALYGKRALSSEMK